MPKCDFSPSISWVFDISQRLSPYPNLRDKSFGNHCQLKGNDIGSARSKGQESKGKVLRSLKKAYEQFWN